MEDQTSGPGGASLNQRNGYIYCYILNIFMGNSPLHHHYITYQLHIEITRVVYSGYNNTNGVSNSEGSWWCKVGFLSPANSSFLLAKAHGDQLLTDGEETFHRGQVEVDV